MVMGIRLKLGNGKEWELTAWEIGGNWNVKIPAGHLLQSRCAAAGTDFQQVTVLEISVVLKHFYQKLS